MGEANSRYFFGPQTQFANVGDTVTWTNGTDAPHTVTSDAGKELASDRLAQNATFEHTFTAQGTFTYHCTIHPYMKGKIVVLAAGAALPATDTAGAPTGDAGSFDGRLVATVLAGLAAAAVAIRRFRLAH